MVVLALSSPFLPTQPVRCSAQAGFLGRLPPRRHGRLSAWKRFPRVLQVKISQASGLIGIGGYLLAHTSFFAGVLGPVPKEIGASAFLHPRADGSDFANQITSLEPQSPRNEGEVK